MLQSMEALVRGQAGPCVAIMMEAVRGLVCAERELAITLLLSVAAKGVTGSAWRSPTAQGDFFSVARMFHFRYSLCIYICPSQFKNRVNQR